MSEQALVQPTGHPVKSAVSLPSFLAGGGEMGASIRAYAWEATPLGHPEGWPTSLKTAVRILLDARYPMFLWWGRDCINIYNDAYSPVLGNRHPEALGKSARELWRDVWSVVGPQAESVFSEGRATWNDEVLLVMERYGFKENTYFTFSYSPIKDEEGDIAGMLGICTDETSKVLSRRRLKTLRDLGERTLAEAKTVERAIAAAAETLRQNCEDVPFALVYLLDRDKQAQLVEVSGNVPKEISSLLDRHAKENGNGFWELQAARTKSNLKSFPFADGKGEQVQCAMVVPISAADANGLPVGYLVAGVNPRLRLDDEYRGFFELIAGHIGTSIATARAYEEERERAEALASIDRAKTTFFSNISHEFRTPLTLMLTPIEELLARADECLNPPVKSQLELVHRNANRLLRLVNTLLDFSRIEAGRVHATYEPTELGSCTAELASAFRSIMELAGLDFLVECSPLSQLVYVDREMWEKIVLNLLSNAFKFTFEGSIRVSLAELEHEVELRVSDTGVGIPVSEQGKIFERFHRVENSRSRTHEGSGIGLSLASELVRLHAGKIRVESEINKGSTFIVTIPFGKDHLPAERVTTSGKATSTALAPVHFVDEAMRWLPEHSSAKTAEMHNGPSADPPAHVALGASCTKTPRSKILIADDNADLRDYLRRILSEKHEVRLAHDGYSALQIASNEPVDLILSDVMMPGIDGVELVRQVRANPAIARVPILLLSARAGEDSRVEGLDTGADDYLVKPFSARELLARVDTHLKLSRAREDAENQVKVILESITDALQVMDREWRLVYMNAAARRILIEQGIQPDSVIGKHFLDEIFPAVKGTIFEIELQRAMRDRVPVEFENYYGEWKKWYQLRIFPVEDGGVSVYFQDITSRKDVEAALRESEARFHAAFKNAALGISLVGLDGRFRDVNPTFCEIIGYTREELLGKTFGDITHPSDLDEDWDRARKVISGELSTYTIEKRYIRKNGTFVWVCLSVSLMRADDGAPRMFVSMIQDIDQRKRAEAAVRLSEERFELAARATNDVVWDWDLRTDSLWWSEALETHFGHKIPDNSSTVDWWFKKIHPEDRNRVHASIRSVLQNNEAFWREEYKFQRQDGSYADILDRAYVLREPGEGKAIRIIGAMQDLSERKRAQHLEEAQKQVLELIALDSPLPRIFDALIFMIEEQSNSGLLASILLLDDDGKHLRHGAAPHLPDGYNQAVDGLEVAEAKGSCGTAAFRKQPVYVNDISKSPLWKDFAELARTHHLNACWSTPILSSSAQLLGTLAVYHHEPLEPREFDLRLVGVAAKTAAIAIERKRAESALARLTFESEQQRRLYETILSSTPDFVYVFDLNHRFTFVNDALLKTWGKTREEALGRNCLELGYEKWHAEMHDREIETVIATRKPIRGEVPFNGANGRRIYDYIFVPVIGKNGEVEAIAGATRDVTERKQAELSIQQLNEQFQTLLNHAPLGIYLVDGNFRLCQVNPTAAPAFRSIPDVVGRDFEEVVRIIWPEAMVPEIIARFRHTLATGEPYHVPELVEERRDLGTREYYEWQIHRIPLSKQGYGVVCYFRDISAQVHAREKIEESARRFSFMAESMPQKIFTATPQGQIDYVNQRWIEFSGSSLNEVGKSGWMEWLHPDEQKESLRRWQQSISTGESFQMEHRCRRKDGVYRWHLTRAHALRDEEGRVIMWIGSNTDIENQKQAEVTLERMVAERTAQLKETIAELESFSYSVSHDLRSPLRAMQGYSEELLSQLAGKLNEEHMDFLQRIQNAAARLDRLTQEVLTYSHLSRAEIRLEKIELGPLLRAIVDQYPNLKDAGAQICIMEPLLNPIAHEAFLTQAISNLLTNAVKFVKPGDSPKVILRTEQIDQRVRIWVEDNGIGIEPRHHDRIFQMFGRIHPESKYRGTGIGLAIVKKSAERMNGKAGFESIPNQGSRFWIELDHAS